MSKVSGDVLREGISGEQQRQACWLQTADGIWAGQLLLCLHSVASRFLSIQCCTAGIAASHCLISLVW